MSSAFWFSYVVLWLLVIVLALLVLLLYRQFGLAYMSGEQRLSMQGLDVGASAPEFSVMTVVDGPIRPLQVRWNGQKSRLLVFSSPSCTVCEKLAHDVGDLPDEWPHVEFIWVDREEGGSFIRSIDYEAGWVRGVAADGAAHREWDVSAVPFAYAVSASGEILAKRLVNTGDDVRDLLGLATESTALASTAEVLQ